jgi:hypothetical protein
MRGPAGGRFVRCSSGNRQGEGGRGAGKGTTGRRRTKRGSPADLDLRRRSIWLGSGRGREEAPLARIPGDVEARGSSFGRGRA